jgi:hypothetical protein
MKREACFLLLIALWGADGATSRAAENNPAVTEARTGDASSMSEQSMMRDLFDRWERVWHEGRFDLVPDSVGEHYIRHDEQGDRIVTREADAAEIAKVRQERPDISVVVYDHSFEGNRAWFRFAFKWTDPKTGEPRSRAAMQSYRTEGGKLVETWLSMQPLGSVGSDAAAQEHWTSPPPIK